MQMLNIETSSHPHVRFFFLCDGVIHRDDGQIDVTRLLTDHVFTSASTQMASCKLSVTVVVGIHGEDHHHTYPLRVTGQGAGEPETPFFSSLIGLVNNQYTPLMIRRCDLEFVRPGTYWFNLYFDGNLAGRYPLDISYATST